MKKKEVLCRVCPGGIYFVMLSGKTRERIAELLKGLSFEVYHDTIIVDSSDIVSALRRLSFDFELYIV